MLHSPHGAIRKRHVGKSKLPGPRQLETRSPSARHGDRAQRVLLSANREANVAVVDLHLRSKVI
jgi:hypothetical protein